MPKFFFATPASVIVLYLVYHIAKKRGIVNERLLQEWQALAGIAAVVVALVVLLPSENDSQSVNQLLIAGSTPVTTPKSIVASSTKPALSN